MGYVFKELLPNVSFASQEEALAWIKANPADDGHVFLSVPCWLGMPLRIGWTQEVPDSFRIRRKKV